MAQCMVSQPAKQNFNKPQNNYETLRKNPKWVLNGFVYCVFIASAVISMVKYYLCKHILLPRIYTLERNHDSNLIWTHDKYRRKWLKFANSMQSKFSKLPWHMMNLLQTHTHKKLDDRSMETSLLSNWNGIWIIDSWSSYSFEWVISVCWAEIAVYKTHFISKLFIWLRTVDSAAE